jgi:CRP/FNR family cyclic AMP-dependent transcriptional regulator
MTTQFEIALLFGAIGALLLVLSNLMKRMVALRVFALAANAFFIIQFAIEQNWILLVLQASLLSINAYRLWTTRVLLLSLERANADTPIRDWLLPQMKKKKYKAGHVLFSYGEPAKELYYVQSGTVTSPEFKKSLGPGHLLGEIGLFSKDHARAATVICETDVVCYTMTDEAAYLLYIQNPQIGFYLIRLIIEQLRTELASRPDAAAAMV